MPVKLPPERGAERARRVERGPRCCGLAATILGCCYVRKLCFKPMSSTLYLP